MVQVLALSRVPTALQRPILLHIIDRPPLCSLLLPWALLR